MKNVHILPTDYKYSRLYFNINDKEFQICEIEKPSTILKPNRHIYITSDEEIKEGDWYVNTLDEVVRKNNTINHSYHKKVILTTDQDLIKDGVQAIDDEFLEWFVNNPSCEEVEVQLEEIVVGSYDAKGLKKIYDDIYKIIIPKEEPKQETIKIACVQCCGTGEIQKSTNRKQSNFECDLCNGRGYWNKVIEPKQETLEEFIRKSYLSRLEDCLSVDFEDGVKLGSKRQQERSYSEEEALNLLTHFAVEIQRQNKRGQYPIEIKGWFERNKETFKKK